MGNQTLLPPLDHPIWTEIIAGRKTPQFEFFAAKIFIGSAQLVLLRDPSSEQRLAGELHKLFEKNQSLPSAKRDLEKLTGDQT